MSKKSEIHKVLLTGIICALIVGYVFSNSKYYYKGREITEVIYISNPKYHFRTVIEENFNFKVGIISGALISAFLLFIYYDENNFKKVVWLSNRFYQRLQSVDYSKPFKTIKRKQLKDYSENFELRGYNRIKRNLNYTGRIGRIEYLVKLIILSFIFSVPYKVFKDSSDINFNTKILLLIIFGLVYLAFFSSLVTKRLQDVGISPIYLIILYIVIAVTFPLLQSTFLSDANLLLPFIFIVILPLFPGTKGENKYGFAPRQF